MDSKDLSLPSTATAKKFGASNSDPRNNASLDDWSNVFRENIALSVVLLMGSSQ
jgi:hypothetical protein